MSQIELKFDLLIQGGKVITSDMAYDASIAVSDGKIACITKSSPEADQVINASGKYVFPGGLDPHVHFREPGYTEKEDFLTGSQSAAAGGVTTVFEMAASVYPYTVVTAEKMRIRRDLIKPRSLVDFALYGGAGQSSIRDIVPMAEAGVIGYKTFMIPPYKGREKDFEGQWVNDDGIHLDMLREVAKTGLVSSTHAENYYILEYERKKLLEAGRKDPQAWWDSRPAVMETEAVQRLMLFGQETGARVHVAHMSAKGGVESLREAKRRGIKATGETCPHYLFMNQEAAVKLGPYTKISPPIRSEEHRLALWQGLLDGTIDMVATDHAPETKENKEKAWDNIWEAGPGAPGVETRMPLMLNEAIKGTFSMEKFVELTSTSAARVFGVYPKKGEIQVGSDGDFILVDPRKEFRIEADKMYTKAKDTALLFDGWKVQGIITTTILRGKVIMQDGQVTGQPGYGEFISPLKRPAAT